RARVNVERGDAAAARLDQSAAKRWASQLKDASTRARFEATTKFVEGLELRKHSPRAAAERFGVALHFFESADRRVEVPRIYLERASVNVELGDLAAARRDLQAGIAFVETERRQIRDLAQRATLLAAAEALFTKAVELAVEAGDGEGAFALCEQHRARALTEMFELGAAPSTLEVTPLSLAQIRAALAPDVAIVEYVVVPN